MSSVSLPFHHNTILYKNICNKTRVVALTFPLGDLLGHLGTAEFFRHRAEQGVSPTRHFSHIAQRRFFNNEGAEQSD